MARGLTLRSLGIGLLLAFGVGAVVPFLGLYVQGSNSGAYFTSQIAHRYLEIEPEAPQESSSAIRSVGRCVLTVVTAAGAIKPSLLPTLEATAQL